MMPLFVSAFSLNTLYEKEIKNLENSLNRLSLPYRLFGFKNTGSWERNCHKKAETILQALNETDKPVVWLDADSIVEKYPTFFDTLDCDISCYHLKSKYNQNEMLSGTLYFANNDKSRRIILRWIKENENNPTAWDQKNLQKVIENFREKIDITPLPVEYIKIFDCQKYQGEIKEPFITHFQASRRLKRHVQTV
jgi:hypothetical protein